MIEQKKRGSTCGGKLTSLRAKQLQFQHPYLATTQQLLVKNYRSPSERVSDQGRALVNVQSRSAASYITTTGHIGERKCIGQLIEGTVGVISGTIVKLAPWL